jgi:hypothetical protein
MPRKIRAKKEVTDMLSETQITDRLEQLGYKSGEIRAALRDVAQVIIAATSAEYLASLSEEKRQLIRSLPEEEVARYISEHRSELPPMSQEAFDKLHDATWEDYFASVG